MAFTTAGHRAPVSYLFVDGGALTSALTPLFTRYWPDESPEFDWSRIGASHAKCFYYDAWPHQKPGQNDEDYAAAVKAHDDLIDHISSTDKWHAYAGESRHRKSRGLEQKMVDVMIAVDMLRHTHKGNMERCILLTNDLDFKPLLDALVQEGMHTTLWHSPGKTNRHLKRSADSLMALDSTAFRTILTPESIARLDPPNASVGPPDFRNCVVPHHGALQDGRQWRYMIDQSSLLHILAWQAGAPHHREYWFQVSSPKQDHVLLFAADVYGVRVELPQ